MDRYDFRPDYDPNLLPQWQGPSQIEEDFIRLVQQLYEQETNSLLYGSEYKEANDELLSKKRQALLERANPFMLRYKFPYEPSFSHSGNIRTFTAMKEDLIDPFESTAPKQALSLSWDIDCLAKNPYKALLSWQRSLNTLHEYLRPDGNPSFLSRIVQESTYYAFHESTLYLLCTFITGTHNDATFNPMQILEPLNSAFIAECKAFWTISDVYPPIELGSGGANTKDISNVILYDYTLSGKSVWCAPSGYRKRIEKPLFNIFKQHIKINGFEIDEGYLEDLINYIVELSIQNGKVYYLLPFVCTKAFAQLFCGSAPEDEIEESLYNYETLERLFDNHHRKIRSNNIYYSDESKHPVIAFMLDVVSLCYQIEALVPTKLEDEKSGDVELERKRAEHEIMNQINTNWMILYLYGNRRLFNNPCICSHYCELRLPVLLRSLFHDEEELEDLRVDISWLFSLAQLGDESDLPTTDFNRLCAACTQELDKISSPEWNEQLAEYIFDPSMWEDNSLKASSTEFQTQIDVINALINKAHTLWEQYRKVNDTPSMVVRAICIAYLFNPICADLDDYLETASSLDMCGGLFGQLREWLALTREDIDSHYDKPSAP